MHVTVCRWCVTVQVKQHADLLLDLGQGRVQYFGEPSGAPGVSLDASTSATTGGVTSEGHGAEGKGEGEGGGGGEREGEGGEGTAGVVRAPAKVEDEDEEADEARAVGSVKAAVYL